MKRTAQTALAALLGLSGPWLAQPLAAQGAPDCGAVVSTALVVVMPDLVSPGVPAGATDAEGWCRIDGLDLSDGSDFGLRLTIGTLRFRGEGLEAFVASGQPPTALEVEITDAVQTVNYPDNPDLAWMLRQQMARNGIDLRLSFAWSPETRDLTVDRFEIDFPGPSAVALTAVAGPVDLSSLGAATTSVLGAGLRSLTVDVTTHGLFETFVLPALVGEVLSFDSRESPEDQFAAAQAEATAFLRTLPDTLVDPAGRQALTDMIAALPRPDGRLQLALTAEPGLGAPRFARFAMTGEPESLDELLPALDGVLLTGTWTPLPAPDL